MNPGNRHPLPRRTLLKALIAAGAAAVLPAAGNDMQTVIIVSRCVGCRECRKICPKNAIRFHAGKASIDPEKCISCRLCAALCSYGAVKVWTN